MLWEIWSRKLPYDNLYFSIIIDLQAVLEGIRPTLSDIWPKEFVAQIKDCWSGAAVDRPTFGSVVERLVYFNETHLLQN